MSNSQLASNDHSALIAADVGAGTDPPCVGALACHCSKRGGLPGVWDLEGQPPVGVIC